LIEEKISSGETEIIKEEFPEAPARKGAEIIDLMAALKKSVQEREKGHAKTSHDGGKKKGRATTAKAKKTSTKRAS